MRSILAYYAGNSFTSIRFIYENIICDSGISLLNFDAIIVGAGPAGSTVAETIAQEGYKVLILEEHTQIGFPQHCAGKLSVNASKELDIPLSGVLQDVRGVTCYSPDLSTINLERKNIQAHIFDRTILDKLLSERATDAGALLYTNARAWDISIDSHEVNVLFKHNNKYHRLTTNIVVGADGASSLIARRLKLYPRKKSTIKVAIQREMRNLCDIKSDMVEIYLGRKYAPGFFAWIIPTGADSVKVGLCVNLSQSKYLLSYLDKFITSHPIAKKKLRGGLYTKQTAHIIPIGDKLRQTVSNGVLLVGDAAGQVKATTGGGLYYAMVSAKIASRVISKALSSGDGVLQTTDLMEYQNLWQKRIGREIEINTKIRCILDSLTDEEVNYLFHVFSEDEKLINLIVNQGDIDWQSRLIAPMLQHTITALVKKPQLFIKMRKLLV